MTFSLLMLAGDGIGPEIMAQTERIIDWLAGHHDIAFTKDHDLIGGIACDKHGTPLPDHVLTKAGAADAILLGAVGGPQWADSPYDKRPEAGLLKLRKSLDLFANLRPALVFDALIDASTLKPEIVRGLDILIVRELTGGVYFGEPRGIETLANGQRRGINTQVYTTAEIHRIGRVAFDLARKRQSRVCSADKANVMEAGKLWREEITALHESACQDLELSHMYADNVAMQLLRDPSQFDVIVTDNLFGDILSDEAAMLTGSLGMLPSASLGAMRDDGRRSALYEPVHGSAPDIAGTGQANPLAMILSFAMALRYSFDRGDIAVTLENAVQTVLNDGTRTGDIMAAGCRQVSTSEMGDAVIAALEKEQADAA